MSEATIAGVTKEFGTLQARCNLLRSLHVPSRPLLLPNAWDVPTARAVVSPRQVPTVSIRSRTNSPRWRRRQQKLGCSCSRQASIDLH
jgi:hypothetical protein